jgi:UDP-N-acetylmuramate--alanine ligase
MKEGYIDAFSKGLRPKDHLVVLPIYYAGGTTSRDISGRDLADGVAGNGKSAEAPESRTDVLKTIGKWKSYVVFGARDETLSDLAKEIAQKLGHG